MSPRKKKRNKKRKAAKCFGCKVELVKWTFAYPSDRAWNSDNTEQVLLKKT